MNTALPISQATALADLGLPGANPDYRIKSPIVHASAVSWGAILAGAAACAALSLILLILGTGLGFSAVSPWSQQGISAGGLGLSAILWLTLTQLFAAGLGGYLAGRLRTRWLQTDKDEVYFRDTAHGFLAWAIASLAAAGLLTSVIGSITVTGVQAAAATGTVVATGASAINSDLGKPDADGNRTGYFMDSLLRVAPGATPAAQPRTINGDLAGTQQPGGPQQQAELTRIYLNTLRTGPMPPEDVTYTAQIVAQGTGLSQPEAEKRVGEVYARMQARFAAMQNEARDTADKARKVSAYAAMWLFVSLLAGAFIASWTATLGGRQRDL